MSGKRLLCVILVALLCVTAAVCASVSPLRKVYSNVPDKIAKNVSYYVEIQRDTETGTDYFVLLDAKGNPVTMCRRDNADGNPYTVSALTRP